MLVLVHAAGASVLSYLPLLELLDRRHAVYAIEDATLSADVPPTLSSIDAVADTAAGLLLPLLGGAQAAGAPACVVAGWSYGGTVAVSLTARLQAGGIKVGSLVLIDATLQLRAVPASLRSSHTNADLASEDSALLSGFRSALLRSSSGSQPTEAAHVRAQAHFDRCTELLHSHICDEELTCSIFDVRPASRGASSVVTRPSCASISTGECQRVELEGTDHWTLLRGEAAALVGSLVQDALSACEADEQDGVSA